MPNKNLGTRGEEEEQEKENAAPHYEGKKRRSCRGDLGSRSSSTFGHQEGSSTMEGAFVDEYDRNSSKKRPPLSNKSEREHNGNSAFEKAKSKEGLNKGGGSSAMRSSTPNSTDRSNITDKMTPTSRQVRVGATESRRRSKRLSPSIQGESNVVIVNSTVTINSYNGENAALDYEGKKKRSSRGELTSPSSSALEHQKMGSSGMESSDDDEDNRNISTKRPRLSNESKREHNGSSAPKKAKSKSKEKAMGSSGGSGKQRASSSSTVRTRLKKRMDLKKKIFISFSFNDKEKALEINKRIEDHFGTCTWICTTDIKPGDILDAKIAEGIHNAKVILCLMSQNFLDSTECEMEVQVARQLKKEFIEVQLEKIRSPGMKVDGKVSSVRMALMPRLYVPLYKDVEGSQIHFEELITVLQGMLA